MATPKRPRPKRTWIQRFFLISCLAVLSISAIAAVLLAYTSDTVGQIPRTAFGNTLTSQSTEGEEPLNFLLIGSDSIANLPEDHPLRWTSGRSSRQLLTDTLIILRLDSSGAGVGEVKASALSIPRDLYLPIAGYRDTWEKVNSLVYFTDKPTLVQSLQDFLEIPIHHVVEVDFNGFMRLFETLGGLDVYLEYPLRDRKAQLDIPISGCVSLTPEQALGLVRTRELQAYVDNFDGWYGSAPNAWVRVDGAGDFGRQERQQDFLILALQQAFDSGFRNPLKISQIVDEILGGGFVILDDRLTPENAINLAQQFKDFRPNELEKYLLPTVYDFANELSIQRLVEARADPILDYFRGVTSSEDESQNTENENSEDDTSGAANSSPTNEEKRAEIIKKAGNIKGC
ncbi:MAG: hypothetical protein CL455_05340 [Acidimicrobiaceae bacterium]|nr:hypothetical protein [Acidimicrobiaceae bacterium]